MEDMKTIAEALGLGEGAAADQGPSSGLTFFRGQPRSVTTLTSGLRIYEREG